MFLRAFLVAIIDPSQKFNKGNGGVVFAHGERKNRVHFPRRPSRRVPFPPERCVLLVSIGRRATEAPPTAPRWLHPRPLSAAVHSRPSPTKPCSSFLASLLRTGLGGQANIRALVFLFFVLLFYRVNGIHALQRHLQYQCPGNGKYCCTAAAILGTFVLAL